MSELAAIALASGVMYSVAALIGILGLFSALLVRSSLRCSSVRSDLAHRNGLEIEPTALASGICHPFLLGRTASDSRQFSRLDRLFQICRENHPSHEKGNRVSQLMSISGRLDRRMCVAGHDRHAGYQIHIRESSSSPHPSLSPWFVDPYCLQVKRLVAVR